MNNFDESKHRRGQPANAGQFAGKDNSAPTGGLDPNALTRPPAKFDVEILDSPDPVGGFDTRVEAPTGARYLRNGKLHRQDGPAYEGRDGAEGWYQDGQLHRDPQEGPALVEDGHGEFYADGQLLGTA